MIKRNFNKSATIPAGSELELFSLWVPGTAKLTLTKFGNYMSGSYWGYLWWEIRRNGVAVYERIKDQVGLIYTPREFEPIIIEGGGYFSIVVGNTHATDDVDAGISVEYELE